MKRLTALFLVILVVTAPGSISRAEPEETSYSPDWIGWFRAGYDYSGDDENGFNNYSARIIAKGRYDSRISYHIMTELINQSAADSRPIFLQGWIMYDLHENISARIGQYKYPFGKEAYGPVMAWKFARPSYVTANIAKKLGRSGGFYRDAGVEITGSRKLSGGTAASGRIMVMNGNGINSLDSNDDKDLVTQAGVSLPYGIELGGSYFSGMDSHGEESAVNGYFIMKQWKIHTQAEYSRAVYHNEAGIEIEPAGFYLMATCQLFSGIETGLRYDSYESNINRKNTDRSRLSLMAAYNFSKMTRIMFNYELLDGTLNENAEDYISLNFYVSFN
jgi:hypothetical protein